MEDLGLAESGAEVSAVLEGPYAQGPCGGAEFGLLVFAGEERPDGGAAEFQGAYEEVRHEEHS